MNERQESGGEKERLFEAYAKERSDLLRNEIVEAHLYIASIIAHRFSGRGVEFEDLYQVASLALIKAVERFDPEKGNKFATFATPTMVGEVKNFFRDRSRLIRLPRRGADLLTGVEKARSELTQTLMRSPTADEIAERLSVPPDDVIEALEMQSAAHAVSLDAMMDDDETPLHHILGFQDKGFSDFEHKNLVDQLMSGLSDTERAVIRGRYFEDLNQRAIADQLSVSQMSISRIERKAISKMKQSLEYQDGGEA